MFKRHPENLADILAKAIRQSGLETPLLQKRLVDNWEKVVGPVYARYTGNKFIKNQILFVKILSPGVREELSFRRSAFVSALNQSVGAQIITDIKIY